MATMNISLPDSLREFVEAEVQAGSYSSASEYFRQLVREQQKRKAQERLELLLLEGLESPAAEVTSEDWTELRRRVVARHEAHNARNAR